MKGISEASPTWRRWLTTIAMSVLILAALAQTAWLWSHRSSSDRRMPIVDVVEGETVPEVPLQEIGGKSSQVSLPVLASAQECQAFIFFSPTCSACARIAPIWAERSEVALPVYWVSLHPAIDSAKAFVQRHRIRQRSYALVSEDDVWALGVSAVPTSWIVRAGRIVAVRWGTEPQHFDSLPGECDS